MNQRGQSHLAGWLLLGSTTAGLWAACALFVYLAVSEQGAGWLYALLAALAGLAALTASVVMARALNRSSGNGVQKDIQRIPVEWKADGFLQEVEKRSRTPVGACYQCHKCSTGCPVGPDMDLLSSQIMRLIHLGAEKETLQSRAIWLCASCEACTTRCPMGIDIAAVMDALRMLAVQRDSAVPDDRGKQFGYSFLRSVQRHGRAFELGLLAFYKLRSGDLFSDMEKTQTLWAKNKLPLLPHRSGSAGQVKKVFQRSAQEEANR